MSIPSELPVWAENANYAAGSEVGKPTKTEPLSGRKADGWSPETPPSAQQFNWILNALATWIVWLVSNVATIYRQRFPGPLLTTLNYSVASSYLTVTTYGAVLTCASVSGECEIDLDIPVGYKLGSLTIAEIADVNTGTTTIGVWSGITLANLGGISIAATPTVLTDYTINFLADTGSVSLTMTGASSSGTITRSTGSFLTDGFCVGQLVQLSGFANSVNNYSAETPFGGSGYITAVSALSMTVADFGGGTTITETATAQIAGIAPTTDGTFVMSLVFTCSNVSGHSQANMNLRYTLIPQ